MKRARLLCAQARSLRVRAASAVLSAGQLRARLRTEWLRRFTTDDPLGPTVVSCAWCGRMRTANGRLWVMSPARPEITRELRVSHGMCPVCRKHRWLGAATEKEAMLVGACIESALSGSHELIAAATASK
jgi:hypothetical protein